MNTMSAPRPCPQCGAPIPAGAAEGLCPRCLLALNLATQTRLAGETQPPAAGPAVPPLPLEEVAKLFPQLEIIRLVGTGGMGAVYQARQPALDRFVALKLLHTPPANDPGFAERFSQEARALAKLNHPNIVALHEFGQAGGRPYFLMEFVDGVNLRQLQHAERLSPREALQIVPQVCDALQYAHDEGIVHRDIKPENVLIDRKGRVKVADFGLAKLMGKETATARLTGAGHVMGTPHYMAPEQVEHPLEVDHRADIFSLGVVFYELLTGELPLGKFPLPSKKVQIDVRLDEVVLRALEKEPALRYGQASELKTRVETITNAPAAAVETMPKQAFRLEYRSKTTLFGLPLLHIVRGRDPETGRAQTSRGIIAIGGRAKGVIAIGGTATGVVAMGGASFGVFAYGGLACGLFSFGGLAVALLAALGGGAVAPIALGGGGAAGIYAYGGKGYGMHVMDSATRDPAAAHFFGTWASTLLINIGWINLLSLALMLGICLIVPTIFMGRMWRGRTPGRMQASDSAVNSVHRSFGWKKVKSFLWAVLIIGGVLFGIRTFVLAPYRVPTSAVSPEIPRGSLVFVFKPVRHFPAGDIIAYRFSADEIRVGRVVREDAANGIVHIERRGETPQQVTAADIIGKVVLNTRAEAVAVASADGERASGEAGTAFEPGSNAGWVVFVEVCLATLVVIFCAWGLGRRVLMADVRAAGAGEPGSRPAVPGAARPRYSRMAISAAGLALLGLSVGIIGSIVVRSRWVPKDQMVFGISMAWLICRLVACGSLVLGWKAIRQIRGSAGRLRGLALAMAGGLLLPLLVLDNAVVNLAILIMLGRGYDGHPISGVSYLAAHVLVLGVAIFGVRCAWKKIRDDSALPSPAKQDPDVGRGRQLLGYIAFYSGCLSGFIRWVLLPFPWLFLNLSPESQKGISWFTLVLAVLAVGLGVVSRKISWGRKAVVVGIIILSFWTLSSAPEQLSLVSRIPPASTVQDAAAVSTPPQLRFLAWQDEVKMDPHWRAWLPSGERVTKADMKLPDHLMTPSRVDVSGTSEAAQKPRFLCVWVSHPAFDAQSVVELMLVDEAGRPLKVPTGSEASSVFPSDAESQNLGWVTAAICAGKEDEIPPRASLKLRYSAGPWQQSGEVPVVRGRIVLGNGVLLTDPGQDSAGRAFVAFTCDLSVDSGDEQIDFVAITTDGRRLNCVSRGQGGVANLKTGRCVFDVPLQQIETFECRKRPIRTAMFKHVPLQPSADDASSGVKDARAFGSSSDAGVKTRSNPVRSEPATAAEGLVRETWAADVPADFKFTSENLNPAVLSRTPDVKLYPMPGRNFGPEGAPLVIKVAESVEDMRDPTIIAPGPGASVHGKATMEEGRVHYLVTATLAGDAKTNQAPGQSRERVAEDRVALGVFSVIELGSTSPGIRRVLLLRFAKMTGEQQVEQEGLTALQAWMLLMDAGRYAESWDAAAESFRHAGSRAEWVAKSEKIRRPLGEVISRTFAGSQQTTVFPGMPDGVYWLVELDSTFSGLKSASETVVFAREKDGRCRMVGYWIRPRTEDEKEAVAAARIWLMSIDEGHYGPSWTNASKVFRDALTREKWVTSLTGVRQPLGERMFRVAEVCQTTESLPGAPAGKYVVMRFSASFADCKSAVETVTFVHEADGMWRAAGYFIK